MEPRIRILLIDDKPTSLFGDGLNYPQVKNDNKSDVRFAGIEDFFEVKWLQSPTDIREYRNLSYEIEDTCSPIILGKEGFVPEIICFDYRLSPGMGNEILMPESTKVMVFPTFRLIDFLNRRNNTNRKVSRQFSEDDKDQEWAEIGRLLEEKGIKPTDDHVDAQLKSIFPERYVPVTGIEQDNMGCFGGGLIAVQFRQHPCVGVPTTSKADTNIDNTEAAYFEWLLHEELHDTFKEKGRMDPRWTDILKLGVSNLRKRIEYLLKGNRIQVSLSDLAQLAEEGSHKIENFHFQSIYGERNLPLAGLFIDCLPEERPLGIKSWASNLLTIALQSGNIEAWRLANEKTRELWEAFDSKDFRGRFMLSDFEARSKAGFPLQPNELKRLKELRTYFDVSDNEREQYRISKKLARDFREYNDLKDDAVQRLIILLIAVNIFFRYAQFIEKMSRSGRRGGSVALPPPGEEDLLAALYPVARNPVVLYNHMSILKGTPHYKKDAITTFTKDLKRLKLDKYRKEPLDFSPVLKSGEKEILKHYAFTLGFSQSYIEFPNWLK